MRDGWCFAESADAVFVDAAASPLSPSVRLKPTGFQSFTTDSDADCAETGWQLKNRSKRELLFRSHRFCIESSVMVNRVISVFVVFSLAWKLMITLSSCCFQSRFAFAWNHAIRSAQCQHSISSFPEIHGSEKCHGNRSCHG